VLQNFCLPWVRQQENWGVSLLSEVLEGASPLVQERLGMLIYGTLGQNSGAISQELLEMGEEAPKLNTGLGNVVMTELPAAIVGEGGTLHPVRRPTRDVVG
jgi:hypothetical protein